MLDEMRAEQGDYERSGEEGEGEEAAEAEVAMEALETADTADAEVPRRSRRSKRANGGARQRAKRREVGGDAAVGDL